jgi:hypothetical protein
VMVRNCQYSVPARFIGRRVRVHLRAGEVIVLDGRTVIARACQVFCVSRAQIFS